MTYPVQLHSHCAVLKRDCPFFHYFVSVSVSDLHQVLCFQAKPHLVDVNVLMAVQLLVEMARDVPNVMLQHSLFQHILFNFKIWSRSQFHIRIGECFKPFVNFSITSDTVASNLPR